MGCVILGSSDAKGNDFRQGHRSGNSSYVEAVIHADNPVVRHGQCAVGYITQETKSVHLMLKLIRQWIVQVSFVPIQEISLQKRFRS